MTRFILAAIVATLATQPAWALSCVKPDLARSFKEAEASDQSFSVALGQIEFDPLVPPFDGTTAPSTSIPGRFDGRALGPDGFNRDIDREIVLEVSCVADTWCGSAGDPGTRVLAFLRHQGGKRILDLNPCPQWLFANPTDSMIELLGECVTGGSCPLGDLR